MLYASHSEAWADVMCIADVMKGRWERESWIEEGIARSVFFSELMQITTATKRERHQTKGLINRQENGCAPAL